MVTRTRTPAAAERASLHRALGSWFRDARRDLPWRRTRDPYAIWISEVLLQQTRVETVVPYYRRFLERFPDVTALATASEGDVLAAWSGLGYYSRARALRAAAQAVVERHAGRLPERRADWLALPGVGPYTAGAVLSIAFGRSEPLVDGNVARVLARLFALAAPLGSAGFTRAAWALADALVPAEGAKLDPGQWNQALMELGARVCTARAPRCLVCPLSRRCRALATGRTEELPRPKTRRAAVAVRLEMLLARRGERVLLVQRPAPGRMAGLWELPTREVANGARASGLWPPAHEPALALEPLELVGELAHAITHHRIRAELRHARGRARSTAATRWMGGEELAGAPLTGLTRKALALARAGPRGGA